MSNEILVAFHNESNYDYHFVIKQLANEFEGQFVCLREKTEDRRVHNFYCSDRKRSYKSW